MLTLKHYKDLDAVALAEHLHNGDYSASEVLNCALEQANKVNPALNAITLPTFEKAKEQAMQLDKNPDLFKASPLAGVPFLIKDISAIQGMPVPGNSYLFDGQLAQRSSNIARRFYDSGLVVLGKTNTPEFCLTITTESAYAGACRNPWNPDYSTGGSSGGSAAAVAAGVVPAAHATDGGGSIRIPAACCGLVGLKPSRGLTVIEDEVSGNWNGMSVANVVSRSVRDSAIFLDLLKLEKSSLFPLPAAPVSFLKQLERNTGKPKIALQRHHPGGETVDSEVLDGIDLAAAACSRLGLEVVESPPPLDYSAVSSAAAKVICVHVAHSVSPGLEAKGLQLDQSLADISHQSGFPLERSTLAMALRGAKISATDYMTALDLLKAAEYQMAHFHQSFDVLLSPVLTRPPAPLGWLDMNSPDQKTYVTRFASYSGFAALFNATGQPSISLPLHHSKDGLPIAVMFSAAWGQDLLLLQLARQLEVQLPWSQRKPPIW